MESSFRSLELLAIASPQFRSNELISKFGVEPVVLERAHEIYVVAQDSALGLGVWVFYSRRALKFCRL